MFFADFELVLTALAVIFAHSTTYGDIILCPQQILIENNSHERVFIKVKNFNESNVTLNFVIQNSDVIEVVPSKINLYPGTHQYEVILNALSVGHSNLLVTSSNSDVRVNHLNLVANVFKNKVIDVVSTISGWIYFVAWSFSAYPQIYINFKRKSVVGLSFDYLAMNILGYISFGVFIQSLYFSPAIQEEYFESFHGLLPVKLNDVFYSLLGFCALCFIAFQCFIYECGSQVVSVTAKIILAFFGIYYIVLFILRCVNVIQWLDFLYYCSYIKLVATVLKNIPQAYMNYKRKSTVGWSVEVVMMNLLGGICSQAQMIFDSYNYNDWASILRNLTKFILGLQAMTFHMIFVIQHYVLYRNDSVNTKL